MKKFIIPLVTAIVVVSIILAGCVPEAAPPEVPPTAPPEAPPTAPPEAPPTAPPEAPTPGEPVVDEWVIPVVTPLSGGFASWGIESTWAIEESAKDINAAGGVRGKPIRFVTYDTGTDPTKAHTQMSMALDTDPLLVALMDVSAQAKAAGELGIREKVYMIMPASGPDACIACAPWNTSFECPMEVMGAKGLAEWLDANPDIERVVVLYDATYPDYEWFHDAFKIVLDEEGKTYVGAVTFEMFTTVDWGAPALSALGKNPDGYVFSCLGSSTASMIQELHNRGVTENRRFFCSIPCDYPELYEIGAEEIDGCYVQSFYDINSPEPMWVSIKQRYEDYTGVPMGFGTVRGYDVPRFIAAAIEGTGVTGDPAKLAEERLMLAKWCWNVDSFPFLVGSYPIIQGFGLPVMFLNVVENARKVAVQECPVTEEEYLEKRPKLPVYEPGYELPWE
jgi:branched-chain amino acid transport system substrate-binding protein